MTMGIMTMMRVGWMKIDARTLLKYYMYFVALAVIMLAAWRFMR